MGVCINHTIGIESGRVKVALDRTEELAEQMQKEAPALGIPFTIKRESPYALRIDIGNCETLAFRFNTYENHLADANGGWSYVAATLADKFTESVLATENSEHLKNWPEQRMQWESGFTKTQYGRSVVEHKMVAELVRSLAMYADYARVYDEGDYYHTGKIEDAVDAIDGNAQVIAQVGGMLAGLGHDFVKGGETVIKPHKKKTI